MMVCSLSKRALFFSFILIFQLSLAYCLTIDKDVKQGFDVPKKEYISVILFFNSYNKVPSFIQQFSELEHVTLEPLNFMPAIIVTSYKDPALLKKISTFPSLAYIALNTPAGEKIEINSITNKPKNSFRYPGVSKWWSQNFIGQSGVIGIIDSGIDPTHPALISKKIIINKTKHSGFGSYHKGIRSPHGTGVACIYAGDPLYGENIKGLSYKAPTILSALAGEGNKTLENFSLTYSSLNWFFSLKKYKPSIINYSFGNGQIACHSCPDWSGMSKVVDYIVNKYNILWVTSAGNNGYIKSRKTPPFTSTMTVPADNYNALTVANMNMYALDTSEVQRKFSRDKHAIRYTSSRGPTLLGRKKPDITAPGNDTYTCTPQPKKFPTLAQQKHYDTNYRLMGGTSAAAPHVGGAVLLIQESGITDSMAIKALLINSADAWADSNKPGPDDPAFPYKGGHHPVIGSHWNPTYGWGYMNLEKAFYQRDHLFLNHLKPSDPVKEYILEVKPQDKITLIHERRVGFNNQGTLWKLSHLALEVFAQESNERLAIDASSQDTVHQVSICDYKKTQSCEGTTSIKVIVRISLLDSKIDGAKIEPFALAYG
ncbi:MAG: S8 family serine peptidase [Legionella sp.]|nr:S8 family serine peptidase [Legionella sp.]